LDFVIDYNVHKGTNYRALESSTDYKFGAQKCQPHYQKQYSGNFAIKSLHLC